VSALLAAAAAAPIAAGWAVHATMLGRLLTTAGRDPLTGLNTRAALNGRTARRLLRSGQTLVLLVDCDKFKHINDTHGHAAGDTVITATGRRLHEIVTSLGGIAVRLGGDEFAAIIPTHAHGRDIAELVRTALCETVEHDGQRIPIAVSVGAAVGQPGSDLAEVMRLADEAMYTAKRTGGGHVLSHATIPLYRTVNGRRQGRPGTGKQAAL
jgi:diguanylate cyclase (GGDEF)-like protein